MNWREGIMRMLRLRDFSPKLEDDEEKRRQLEVAKQRLRYLDGRLEIIERRGNKP